MLIYFLRDSYGILKYSGYWSRMKSKCCMRFLRIAPKNTKIFFSISNSHDTWCSSRYANELPRRTAKAYLWILLSFSGGRITKDSLLFYSFSGWYKIISPLSQLCNSWILTELEHGWYRAYWWNHTSDLPSDKNGNRKKIVSLIQWACEKTRVFSCVLLLMVMIIVILHKKGYSSPYPIRMLLWTPMRQLQLFSVCCDIYKDCVR